MTWAAADAAYYDQEAAPIEVPAWRSLILNGADLDATTFPPLRWAVHGLIPEGFGLLTGPPKAGKSWLVGGLALAVSGGQPALGKIAVNHARPVLYLALEDGPRRLQGRSRTLLGEGVAIPPLLDFVTQMSTVSPTHIIAGWLEEHGHHAPLVVLDTLGKVMPDAKAGESAYSRDYRIGSLLKGLVDKYPGATLLAVHHVRKAVGEDWMDSTSGTNGLNGAADFTLNVSRQRNSDEGILRVTGRDVPENEYAVTTRDGSWTLDGQELADAAAKAQLTRETSGLGDRSAEIVQWLNEQPTAVSPREVEEGLGIDNARIYLKRLVDRGSIEKLGRGLYKGVTTVTSVTDDDLSPSESYTSNSCDTPSQGVLDD
ncbi:hypothetical protein ASD11_04490 [Aeromicrobium sp. Root495]|uniref:AAA family ATPase n=1 Tax=Aeromicrobium sp. Root495 TaxID=1736550 RepID=UPI0006F99932|nr:AAA family ATPase [Aeromicrobium sp. Root495]KQY58891.1 hypothetical protein ASD11_04490 [Aeromicrobium sp. Root495]